MTEHLLTIEVDTAYAERFPDFEPVNRWSIACINPDQCNGWIECDKPHEVDGVNASDGPYDSDDDAPWSGYDEFEFHDEEHSWRDGYGWTVPYKGCVVQGQYVDLPDELDLSRLGEWIVEDDWDDTECTLTVVREAGA
jgi:hypothetical protein